MIITSVIDWTRSDHREETPTENSDRVRVHLTAYAPSSAVNIRQENRKAKLHMVDTSLGLKYQRCEKSQGTREAGANAELLIGVG